ncbi:MAG: LysR family transcriptional regulator [Gammaproteobacteria bacterium]|nr:LysR family transcriptional regulator [Gammaproteobacteria bacterium]MCH9743836.1 LysR family transcriptional regulator [Gammaproteobacteria bacterium]
MNSDLQYIVTFIKVIEFGSFSQAAEELGVSKSVVSKHVSALESSLKTQLLKRTTRKLVLTDTGQAYYQQVKNIPEQLTNAQQTLQPYSEKPHGVLKVIAPENFYNAIRETVVPQFLLQNPEVSLQLQFVRPAKNYINDDFDIIILWKYGHLNFPDYNLIPFGIYSMPIQLYATPGYLKKHGTPKTPQDLLQHNCFASVQEAWPFKKKTEDLFHINIKPSLITKNDIIIHGAVVADVGIAYAYPRLFADDLKSGKVVQVLPEYTPLTIDFYAFYHPSPFQPLKIKAFLEQLKQLR